MMGKTHIAAGVAASTALLTFVPAFSDAPITAALIGGAAGGIFSDVDVESNDYCKDALYARIIAGIIIVLSFLIDWIMHLGVCDYIAFHNYRLEIIGVGCFACICLVGAFVSKHRTFTHSLLAMILTGASLALFCWPLVPFYLAGFISHLILDILNKQEVQILFPLGDGFCLGLCYAKGVVNVVFLFVCTGLSLLFIGANLFGFDPTMFLN